MNFKKVITVLLFALLPYIIWADIRMNALFADHMVVQRETEIPVWGWANPHEKILIEASWGEKAETFTSVDSTWSIKLKTPIAGGPFQISISGKNKIIINDVLSGEVWLCSGQSNMDFEMAKFVNDARESQYQPLVEYIRNEVATANDPWLRHIEVPHSTSLYTKKFNFEGNWISVNPEQIGKITATGYFFAKELRKQLNIPIGLIECSWGGTRIQPWISEKAYMDDDELKAYFEKDRIEVEKRIIEMNVEGYVDTVYQNKHKAWLASGQTITKPWPSKHPEINEQIPATLHNGMISSIVPYAIKGVIWYQGESNSHYLEDRYEKYFKTLISSWRTEWGQGDFPFYFTQLAAYHVPDERSDLGWASVNDQLRKTLILPNTGMAVLYDIGEAKDVHPHNKMDTGKRLAFWALEKDYQLKVPAISGPLYKNAIVLDETIEIEFDNVGTGLMVGYKDLLDAAVMVNEPLKCFQIAGNDGIWKPANAKIISKNKVVVSCPEVNKPIKVRYAWSSNPEGANLYNKEGLPAAVFSTEN